MLKRVATYAIILMTPLSAVADDTQVEGILAMAKYAGFCGAIIGMYGFQKSTKMPGGDEFLARFVATEAARLGVTLDKLMENCRGSISGYDELMAASGDRR